MNRSIQHGKPRQARMPATPAVAPISRAIRAALAVSATMLTLAAPVTWAAGTCSYDVVTNTYTCNGDFGQTIPGGVFTPPVDLTLVVGDQSPTSVHPADGLIGIDATWDGDVSVLVNAGSGIESSGADGIHAYSGDATAVVANYGSVSTAVTAAGAEALDVGSVYDVTVVNGGDVSASDSSGAYDVIAVGIHSISGAASFDNQAGGTLVASAYDGSATALSALVDTYYGSLYVSNEGTITADSIHGDATGIVASAVSYGYTTVENGGTVAASGYGHAYGAVAVGAYSSTLDNSGSISASANAVTGDAIAYAASNVSGHLSYLSNEASGSIVATAHSVDGSGVAVGAYAVGGDVTTLHNYGAISASAASDNGGAQAYAAVVEGYSGTGLIINGGDLDATASAGAGASAVAEGALAVAGVASIFNDADIHATATAGYGGGAAATGARALGANSAIYTYGDLDATATAAGGTASATGAYVYGSAGSATFYNAGDVAANATADNGVAVVIGAGAVGVYNSYATNKGTISATGNAGQVNAVGLLNQSYFVAQTTNDGSVSVVADGTLAAYGQYEAVATGIYTFGTLYDAVVDNSGSVSVSAAATADVTAGTGWLVAKAIGVRASNPAGYGQALVDNSGDISASAATGHGYAAAWGVAAQSGSYGHGDVEVGNIGSISGSASSESGSAVAFGAYLHSGSTANLVNHGDVAASVQTGRSVDYYSIATAYATGAQVYAFAYGGGVAAVHNYGTIGANAVIGGGITRATALNVMGQASSVYNAQGATIAASAAANLYGSSGAVAVNVGGLYSADVVNDGDITAYGSARGYANGTHTYYGASRAMGVYAKANYRGNVSVVNHGDVSAHAVSTNGLTFFNAGAGATGISTYAKYNAVVENSGQVSAIAESQLGNVGAYGVMDRGKYYSHVVNDAGASIVAYASSGSLLSDQYGGRAVSFGTHSFGSGSSGVTYNAGTIISRATVTADGGANAGISMAHAWGASIGAYSSMNAGTIVNAGDIEAAASADFGYAGSFGSYVLAHNDSVTSNTGTIRSTASANSGDANAVGSYAMALHQQYIVPCDENGCDYSSAYFVADGGSASLDNSGEITAVATAHGGTGHAYGATILGAFSTGFTNSGHISASVDADDARAVGGLANSAYGYASLQNSGTIGAIATGTTASASGVFVAGDLGTEANGYLAATVDNQGSILAKATGDTATAIGIESTGWGEDGVRIDNAGTVVAAAYGANSTATAVSMDFLGANVLTNTGSIGAYGDGARIAVSSGAGATATITNAGKIVGAIVTGDLDDSFSNAVGATWHAIGSSDFGDGDDHVTNSGTVFMDNAAIHLGGYVNGNTFDNLGTINVTGAGNLIDMDNPFPVNNNGIISFLDGAPDDVLTVAGNFAGTGALNVDVSGARQVSDQLHVGGNVVDTAKQVVNVDLLDMPTAPSVDIPVVSAGGTVGGDFTLGQVRYARGGFVTTSLGLQTSSDTVSLVLDVTGLGGTGLAASNIAPGVQSLIDSEVGTWRQRVGAYPDAGKVGLTPWARTFSASGDISPNRDANFGLGGSGDFHQSNQGTEAGIEARTSDHVVVGMLAGTSDGSQRLNSEVASDRLVGHTFGIYATWLGGHGFYLDASQRWVHATAHLRSGMVAQDARVAAAAFNAEAGFTAFDVSGIHVVPQLQYTHTRIGAISAIDNEGSTFANQGGVSSRARLGVAFDKTIQGAHFSWTPYGSLNAVHVFGGNYHYAVDGGLLGSTSIQGTSAMAAIGMGVRRGGFSLTGEVNWTDGGASQNVVGAQLVARYSW